MKRLHGKKGFTLVEMMVTLAIVGIMLAGSVMGVGAYINYASFRSNNDCAYSLFMTIQSALAQEKASGKLERIKNSYAWENPVQLSGSATGNSEERTVQSLIIPKGQLASPEGKIFLDIAGDYIYDQSMLDASILVELDITEGTLYSVAYSKQASSFSYDSNNTTDRNGVVSVAFGDRARSIRRGTQLGYYSSDLPDPAPSSLGKPNISYVMLTNGETLDLSWRMSGRYRVYTQNLVYTVKLTNAAGEELASFKINDSNSMIPNNGTVTCNVKFKGGAEKYIDFQTYVDAYEVHLVLDKVDLSAAGQSVNYEDTQSAMRLSSNWGGYVGDIRATVYASRATVAESDPKTSAAESLLFGTKKLGDNTIQNARHLFNLRFVDTPAAFKQTASFAWGGESGIIAHGNVANGSIASVVTNNDAAFPSIPSLASGSTLEGSKNIKINYLTLEGAENENGIALFCENNGKIKNVTFAHATVNAPKSDIAAVVCGVNHGSLVEVTVEKNCKVEGQDYVGGIAGYDDSVTDRTRSDLKNAANVTGRSYVGGIFGATKRPDNEGNNGTSGIMQCENTGAIRSSSDDGYFIGGITGLNSGRTLNKCTSTPAGELSKVAPATDLKGRFVGGIVGIQKDGILEECKTNGGLVAGGEYVGGIIGLNAEANLSGLTGTTNSHNRADVTGKKYVGGIAGANVGANIRVDSSNKRIIIISTTTSLPVVTATVTDIGVTANANGTWPQSENELINWTNEGIVVANDSYAGGIVGFNAGVIQECSSNVNVSSTSGSVRLTALQELAVPSKLGRLADFTGGIAGANVNEIIAPTDNSRFVCVTAGRDYVGGIVGFNAPGGSVEGYKVDDAYVYGRCFVGGLMGLNSEANIYEDDYGNVNTIEVHPSRVEGEYFVGGIMGGSIIASDDDVTLHCIANNYQGNIVSENGAGVGGLIGYNAMLEDSADCFALAQKLTAKLDDWLTVPEYAPVLGTNYTNDLRKITRLFVNDIDGMDVDNNDGDPARYRDELPEPSNYKFIIEPLDGANPYKLNIEFSSIEGYLYAGGAIGYNCKDTLLDAINIVNFSNVSATGAIEEIPNPTTAADWANLVNPRPNAETFSYSGGIAGRVTQHMQIVNCANDSNARVHSAGTYSGMLTELNEGVIGTCTTIGTVSPGSDNLGGIAGLNRNVGGVNTSKTSGYIVNCSLTGDLRGGDGVGGIVASNRGLIENCSVGTSSGITIAGDSEVGAIAAQNDGTIKNCIVAENTEIQGEKNVGGITGKNGGSIIECTVATGTTITGDENVGGFAGYQKVSSSTNVVVENLTNVSTLTGKNYVGGIIGKAEGALTLRNCENTKPISAVAENGFAGGILAFSNNTASVIENCKNSADIAAPTGNAGGIVGYSMGTVTNCSINGSAAQALNITAGKNAGGIVGESGGSITDCTLTNVNVSGATGADGCNVGGVVGMNTGLVGIASATNLSVTGAANGGTLGGLVGQNRGSVTGAINRTAFNATVTLDTQFVGYTGGIVGWNRGQGSTAATIENYTFAGKVSAGGSSLYGYGGVAGANGDPDSLTNIALIENCRVNSVVAYKNDTNKLNDRNLEDATDDACTILTTVKADVCVGGIAGLNCQNSRVLNSTLESCYIRGYYGYVGGIVGHNKGDVSDCGADTATNTTIANQKTGSGESNYGFLVKVYMYNGDVGGIVGRTSRTATVEHCATGQDWAVLVTQIDGSHKTEGTDNTCAGIIGYNTADNDLIGLENFARVRKCDLSACTTGAGIIGRQEKITSSSWKVASCTNYGNVETGYRAGGIIGQWKYNGGTLINCANFGYIYARNGAGSGGIVGSTYGASANQRYNITACFNNGTIIGANSGGIIGIIEKTGSNVYVTIIDCVNTGSAQNGGIVGNRSSGNVIVSRCINYNTPGKGIVGSGSATVTNSICVPNKGNDSIGGSGTRKLNFMLRTGTATSVATNTVLIPMGVVASGTSLKAEGSVGAVKYVIPELALDPNATDNPYGNYLAINDQLVAFLKSLYSGTPAAPEKPNVSTSDGAYLATWNNAANAYQYEVTVEVGSVDNNTNFVATNTTVYTALENRLSFTIDSKYENKGLKYRVSVVTINGNGYRSATATTATLEDVLTSLVMPKAQYEIVYENDALMGRWRLLNYDEYTEAYGTNTDVLRGINVSGSFSSGTGDSSTFTVDKKQSVPTTIGGTNNSLTTTVNATGTNYIDSLTFSVQTQRFDAATLASNTQLSTATKEPYLTGIRPGELVCKITLNKNKEQVLRRTELVVTNTDLGEGVEVVIAESHNDRITATHDLSMKLTDKLEGNQPYIVRSYPWGTQGVADGNTYISGCAYGHDVAKNVSRASLTDIVDPWAAGTTIYNGTTKTLTKGYVLSLNDDGTYDVYYSVMLASTATPTNAQRQFIIKNMTPLKAVAAPVLNPTFTTLNGSSTFTWTATDATAADKYEATVLATTFDNREVNVVVPNGAIANTAEGGSLTLNLSTGNYRSVKVAITRLGTEDAAGKTTLLGSTSEPVTYTIPRTLPTMGAPGVALKDTAEVQYIVRWSTEQSYAGNDTKGYTLWLATSSTLASPTALATPSTLASNTATTTVDLEAYQGQQVWLYLTAHCIASPTNYTEDSGNGATTMKIVASRISLSTATDIVLSDAYIPGTATTVERFNKLGLRARDIGNTAAGSFVMQAMILPNESKQADGAPVATDTGLVVAWDGATPATKSMNSSVSNSLSALSSYALNETAGFSDDYAAMWVCARVRAASASNELDHLINSLWSEYKWIRLPRVQLGAPHSEAHTSEPLYYATSNVTYTVDNESSDDPPTLSLQQPTLEWTWDEHAKDCNITIVGKDAADNDVTYGIQLSRNAAGTVRATNTSVTTTPTTMMGAVDPDVASTTTFTWKQSASSAAVPQYGDTKIYTDAEGRQCTVNVETRLVVTNSLDMDGNLVTTCTLLLPDYDEVTERDWEAVFNTKSVALQYTPLEPERYEASLPVTWAWANNPNATAFATKSYVFNGGIS